MRLIVASPNNIKRTTLASSSRDFHANYSIYVPNELVVEADDDHLVEEKINIVTTEEDFIYYFHSWQQLHEGHFGVRTAISRPLVSLT